MVTVTFDEDVKLTRNSFKNVDDFLGDMYEQSIRKSGDINVDFKEHKNEELSSSLLEKVEKSKAKPLKSFTNLSKVSWK